MREFALVALLLCLFVAHLAEGAGNCGEKKTIAQQLIANGYRAVAGSWPWHGAMFHRHRGGVMAYACGVTILTEQFVITAAHCTIDPNEGQFLPPQRMYIKVGISNLNSPERHMQQHDVDRIIRHEEYDAETFENDIALLKLYTDISYNNYIQPICLWQGDTRLSKIISKVGYIVGWGLTEEYKLPQDLNEATVPIVTHRECINSDKDHFSKFVFESKTFCGGYRNGTHASQGDSGGGMFLFIGGNWVLRGIVSNTKANPNTLQVSAESYVVFTDASYYLDWLNRKVTITTSYTIDAEPLEEPPGSSPGTGGSGSQANLLDIASCGKDSYKAGTPEEVKGYLNQYPWLAVIEYINTNTRVLEDSCHAVLIHPSFLVTVAHCVQPKRLLRIHSVRLNDYRLDTVTDIFQIKGETIRTTATKIPVRAISVHPDYDKPKYTNSIALIKLAKPSTAIPICLPPRSVSTLPSDKKYTIIGWKRSNRMEKPMIRNVVQLADFGTCQRQYAAQSVTLDTRGGQVCSTYSHDDDSSSSCSHYLGAAPFQYVKNGPIEGRYFLAALSNFGHSNCKREEYPDVFTNVGHYSEWIRQKVTQNQ